MKYRKKPIIIEAEVYYKGIEDGFGCIPFVALCKWTDEKGNYKQCKKCTLDIPKKPYIEISNCKEYIDEGDYIIERQGERYVCDPDTFKANDEAV